MVAESRQIHVKYGPEGQPLPREEGFVPEPYFSFMVEGIGSEVPRDLGEVAVLTSIGPSEEQWYDDRIESSTTGPGMGGVAVGRFPGGNQLTDTGLPGGFARDEIVVRLDEGILILILKARFRAFAMM